MAIIDRLCGLLGIRTRRMIEREEHEARMAEHQAEQEARRENHRQRIARARRHLTGTSWRDPEGKEAFVDEVYEGKVPSYLWYALGNSELSDDDFKTIVATFWGKRGPSFGDAERHPSSYSGVGVGLRIRNPRQVAAEIEVAGKKCPLFQTGYGDPYGYISDEPAVLFLGLYEEQEPAGCSR